ncbi:MAG TPA: choice-of-anchor V domain-containing protein [Saprospiraceae bacterium]|nr:choice-of-anchor V domain-containing protein [Saprospiraceae bacterium]
MKKNVLLTVFTLSLFSIVWMGHNTGAAKIQGKDRTGSPVAFGTCSFSGCHTGGNFGTKTTLTFTDPKGVVVTTKYKPSTLYSVKINVAGTAMGGGLAPAGYGFQVTALRPNNDSAGTFSNAPVAQIINIGARTYVEQAFQNTGGNWLFKWSSPAKGTGQVKFYACGLAVDNKLNVAGDESGTLIKTLEESTATYEVANTFSVKMNNVIEDELYILLSSDKSEEYKFELIDLSVKVLKSEKQFVNNGLNTIVLSVGNLPTGIHLLHISKNGEMITKKFIKY